MQKKEYKEINLEEYEKYESRVDNMSYDEYIDAHKKLVNTFCKNDYYEIKDCGVRFIKDLLGRDYGRSIVYNYSNDAEKFLKSEYLSYYFKSSIKELLLDKNPSEDVLNILNSDKKINDMSENEIFAIYFAIKEVYDMTKEEIINVAGNLKSLLYKLDGKGVTSFIKNNTENAELASIILNTSGLTDRASYYSGRGVNYSDLNEKNLLAIFKKLFKYDENYGMEFIELVHNMETLGATEFINSFWKFAHNGFKADDKVIENSNISLDGAYGAERDIVAMLSLFSTLSRGDDMSYQMRVSAQMKESFVSRAKQFIRNNKEENNSESLNQNKKPPIKRL